MDQFSERPPGISDRDILFQDSTIPKIPGKIPIFLEYDSSGLWKG